MAPHPSPPLRLQHLFVVFGSIFVLFPHVVCGVSVRELMKEHADVYEESTKSHAFLKACRDGTIDEYAFNTWLVQDSLFVDEFFDFTYRLYRTADRHREPEAAKVLKDSLGVIEDELAWFDEKIDERAPRLKYRRPSFATKGYTHWLHRLNEDHEDDFVLKFAIFYGVEKVYQEAWESVRLSPNSPKWMREYAERWGSREFGEYVDKLEKMADGYLQKMHEDEINLLRKFFRELLEFEVMFWSMALAAEPDPDEQKTVVASPEVWELAKLNDVDLEDVVPSGSKGRILVEDVIEYVERVGDTAKRVENIRDEL